ncbi:MAG: dTMP kinase [Roseibacillus sp.]|nr:dTMP kinase [Roseibacillus sp.]MCP4728979.1 dTMP kinase [Roseibacillus sp.]HJM62385.1 dTMP kinase [Roseibacillus sp.]
MSTSRNHPGLLIVLEGIDGTGKSTQAELLAKSLRQEGCRVILSREPTDGPFGRKLRESATSGRLSPEEELQLFHQDRREHVEKLIDPALQGGEIVILDRYYFSTMAYQGVRGFDPGEIRRINEEFAPRPDLLLLLDLSLDTALERIGVRDGQGNEFEQRESLQLCSQIFHSVQDDFLRVIDADQSIEDIHGDIMAAVNPLLQSSSR